MPTTLSNSKTAYANGGYINVLQSKFTVSEIAYEFNGAGQASACKIGCKVYGSEGYVLKDGKAYTMGIAMNGKFKDTKETVYSLKPRYV